MMYFIWLQSRGLVIANVMIYNHKIASKDWGFLLHGTFTSRLWKLDKSGLFSQSLSHNFCVLRLTKFDFDYDPCLHSHFSLCRRSHDDTKHKSRVDQSVWCATVSHASAFVMFLHSYSSICVCRVYWRDHKSHSKVIMEADESLDCALIGLECICQVLQDINVKHDY